MSDSYGHGFQDDEDEELIDQEPSPSVVRQAIANNQARPLPKYQGSQASQSQARTKVQSNVTNTSTRRKPMTKQQTTSIGSFNLEEEIKAIAKAKDLTDEQASNLFQFWTNYFERRPDEMARLYYLRDENPNEFRALLINLPFSANRHRIETGYFLMAMFGMGCTLLFAVTWLTGSFDSNRGWNYAKSKNALPNVVEALYSR